jgi:hypothetical protein
MGPCPHTRAAHRLGTGPAIGKDVRRFGDDTPCTRAISANTRVVPRPGESFVHPLLPHGHSFGIGLLA